MSEENYTIEKQQSMLNQHWAYEQDSDTLPKAKAKAYELSLANGCVYRVVRQSREQVYQTDQPEPRDFLQPGYVVRFLTNVDRYPHALIKAGETGTVAEANGIYDDLWFSIRLHQQHKGLEEWDNCVHYTDSLREWPQVEIIGTEDDSPRPEPVPGDPNYRTPEQQETDDLRSDLLEAVSTLSDLMGLYGGEPASDDEETVEVWDAARAVVAKHTGGLLKALRPEYHEMVNWSSEQFLDCGIEMPAEQYRLLCVERTRLHPDTTLDQISQRLARKFSKILVDAMTPDQIFLLGRGLHPNNIIDANQCMIEAMADLRIPDLAGTWASVKMSGNAFDIARDNGYFLAEHLK